MRFTERNDLANRCKEWIKDQIENNITIQFDPVHLVLAYLDVNGYLNEAVRCKDCTRQMICFHSDDYFCSDGERREE